jgi:hypothetical protein
MPRVELTVSARRTSTTDLLRAGRGVLLDMSADHGHHTWLREITAGWEQRVIVVAAEPEPGSTVEGLPMVLLRPDGHVAWVGDPRSDPRAPLSRWFGPGTH